MKIKELSVFFPAYNEEDNIENTVLTANGILKEIAEEYEIIIVDDGSIDKTNEIIKKLAHDNDKIKIIEHKINRGYGASVISGFYNCKYEWIAFTDSDGQFDFSEITNLISRQKDTNADLVIGSYINRKVSKMRKFNTWTWQFIVNMLFGLKVKDIDCGFKLIRKKVIDEISKLESQRGAFISTEFLVKSKRKGFKIEEIPVNHYPRVEGAPTGADFKVILSSFKDLFSTNTFLKFIKFCSVGLTSALISLIIFNILLYSGAFFKVSLIFGILFSIMYNFIMNRELTFSSKSKLKSQVIKYGVVYSIAQSINIFTSIFIASIIGSVGIYANISVLAGIIISIPFSFFGHLLWTFRTDDQNI